MKTKLIPNRFLNLYRRFNATKNGFTLKDVVSVYEEDLEPTDKLFSIDECYAGIRDGVYYELRKFLDYWYEKDKVFANQYKSMIVESEREMPKFLRQLKEIEQNARKDLFDKKERNRTLES